MSRFIVLLAFLIQACSSVSVDENDPASLYKDAESEIQSEHYQIAIEKLRVIKNKFPYSKYAVEAQLRIADVYFLQESFAEAALSYESFRELHPKHEKVPYVMYKAGKSYFNDVPSNTARDLTAGQKALDAMNEFVRRFPLDPLVAEVKKDIGEVRRLLAEKELSIGDFYFRREFYDSAKPRYQKTIDLYPETDAAKAAQEKLNKIEDLKLGQ